MWAGRRTGIFSSWEECAAHVSGFSGAEFKGFPSLKAAESAFSGRYEEHKGGAGLSPASALTGCELKSLSVDASCVGNPGPVEYRCVETGTGVEVFRRGPFARGSNNIGEFLAIVHALAHLKATESRIPIYSDSRTAINWVTGKRCRTTIERSTENRELFGLVERAERWLQRDDLPHRILKWRTTEWGEIPADFGRK